MVEQEITELMVGGLARKGPVPFWGDGVITFGLVGRSSQRAVAEAAYSRTGGEIVRRCFAHVPCDSFSVGDQQSRSEYRIRERGRQAGKENK